MSVDIIGQVNVETRAALIGRLAHGTWRRSTPSARADWSICLEPAPGLVIRLNLSLDDFRAPNVLVTN